MNPSRTLYPNATRFCISAIQAAFLLILITTESKAGPLPSIPGYSVELYAHVTDPGYLTFDSSGYLYAARDNTGSGGGFLDAVKIHQVSLGGTTVSEYGLSAIRDPDVVAVDTFGRISGSPGSVLVGGRGISAILPNQTVTQLISGSNIAGMTFDSVGDLLFTELNSPTVFKANGTGVTPLFSIPSNTRDVKIGSNGNIYTSSADGKLREHSPTGQLLNDSLGSANGIVAVGRGGAFGEDIYTASPNGLQRIDSNGNTSQLTPYQFSGIAFDANGAMYLSDFGEDRVLRVTPDQYVFRAPFLETQPHLVTQGPSGGASHRDELRFDIDFAATASQETPVPIMASLGGIAYVHADQHPGESIGFGNLVTIDHGPDPRNPGQRILSIYAHLDKITITNGPVKAGDIIGTEGTTGNSTGRHLHFGVYSGDPTRASGWTPVGLDPLTAGMQIVRNGSTELMHTDDFISAQGEILRSDISAPIRVDESGVIQRDEVVRYNLFFDSPTLLDYQLTWPGSELSLTLADPNGVVTGPISNNIGDISGRTLVGTLGVWSIDVRGIEVSPGGEPFQITVNARPVAEPPAFVLVIVAAVFLTIYVIFEKRFEILYSART